MINNCKNNQVPDFLFQKVGVLVNFTQDFKGNAISILENLKGVVSDTAATSLFVELSEKEIIQEFADAKYSLSVILKLKRFLYLAESYIVHTWEVEENKLLTELGRKQLLNQILSDIRELKLATDKDYPPVVLQIIYDKFKFYEYHYLTELRSKNTLPNHNNGIEKALDTACDEISRTIYKKFGKMWLIPINEKNHDHLKKEFSERYCILVTEKTKQLVGPICNGPVIWLLSEEQRWQNSTQPIFIYQWHQTCLLGMVNPLNTEAKSPFRRSKNKKPFFDACTCDGNLQLKAWICLECKSCLKIFSTTSVSCKCGVQKKKDLIKCCFHCRETVNERAPICDIVEPENKGSASKEDSNKSVDIPTFEK